MNDNSANELRERVRSGDSSATKVVVALIEDTLSSAEKRLSSIRAQSPRQDLLGHSLLGTIFAAFINNPSFRSNTNLKAWFFTVARNKLLRRACQQRGISFEDLDPDWVQKMTQDEESDLDLRDEIESFTSYLRECGSQAMEAFAFMHEMVSKDLTTKEVAAIHGISASTLSRRFTVLRAVANNWQLANEKSRISESGEAS